MTNEGYQWDCPNCGERITSHTKPPLLGADALAAERRATWDRVNDVLDEHVILEAPVKWNALRRAILDAEADTAAKELR